ncbi:hypothetical protein ACSBR1_035927 [Camellia fascicularis]
MMANKHLHELLKEDQEPFLLKKYIADRRSQLNKPTPKPSLQRNPIIESSSSKRSLYKHACFLSFPDSPDLKKSPATSNSTSKSPNAVILHVPSRTSALLLEAAMRIQNQKQSSSHKPKTRIKNAGFGLFGSILNRLSSKNRTQKCEIGGTGDGGVPRKSAGKGEKKQESNGKSGSEMGFSCSGNHSRRNSSTVWSESNEEKSLDLESSSSSRSDEDSEEIEFAIEEKECGGFGLCENEFCLSPFRFVLQKSPSPGRRTPVFSSPATSPSPHRKQEKEDCEVQSIQKIQLAKEEEEEKEQCSPVSVLDPQFEDDDDGNHDEDNNDDDEDSSELECSYAIVQKAKHQLLLKLRRFEKLAELDPIELEKRMLKDQDDEDENEDIEQEECEEDASSSSYTEKNVDGFVRVVLGKLGLHQSKVLSDMERLVSDLIAEERREDEDSDDSEVVAKRVCKRLDSWKEVKSNTIDMMVELDFRREIEGWKVNDKELVRETAKEIELAIFGMLMEELSEELVFLPSGKSPQSFCSSM